jgi:hypothetical protein
VLVSITYVLVRMAYVLASITYALVSITCVLLFTFCNIVDDNDFCRRRKVPCSHELQVFPLKNISLYFFYNHYYFSIDFHEIFSI